MTLLFFSRSRQPLDTGKMPPSRPFKQLSTSRLSPARELAGAWLVFLRHTTRSAIFLAPSHAVLVDAISASPSATSQPEAMTPSRRNASPPPQMTPAHQADDARRRPGAEAHTGIGRRHACHFLGRRHDKKYAGLGMERARHMVSRKCARFRRHDGKGRHAGLPQFLELHGLAQKHGTGISRRARAQHVEANVGILYTNGMPSSAR